MKITAQQYISNSKGDNSYVSVFRHYYDKTERRVNKQGDIYSLIDISSEKKINAERISRFVWNSIVDGYLYSSSKTTNESLKEAIEEGVRKVKDLITNNRELEEKGVDVSFTIALVKDEGTYVGVFGENEIYVFKNNSLTNISEILKEKRASTAGINLEKNDLLMISSANLLVNYEKRFSNFKDKKDLLRSLNSIGEALVGTRALLFLAQETEQSKAKEKNKLLISGVEEIRERAKSMVKPIPRIERIKKPEEEEREPKGNFLKELREKYKLDEKFSKIKPFLSKIYSKVTEVCEKVKEFSKEKWDAFKERVVLVLGKKRWFKRIAAKVSEMGIRRRRPVGVQGMRIDNYKTKDLRSKRFKILFMFLVVAILLVLGVNFTIKGKKAKEVSKQANEAFVQVEEFLRKSEDNFVSDRTSAETYLYQAEKALEELPEELGEKDLEKSDDLKKRVLEIGDSLYKRVGFRDEDGKFETFVDARLAFGEGSNTVAMAFYQDDARNEFLVVADSGRKAVYRVSLYDKSVKALPDDNGLIKDPQFVHVGAEGVYVFDQKEGMLKASFDDAGWFNTFSSLSGLGVREIRAEDIAEMTVWEGENIYFLSRDRSTLLRSSSVYEDRYGLPYSFLEHESMANATHVIADLSIYIITKSEPHVIRFNYSYFESKFYEAPLGILGFDGNFEKVTKGFTGDSLEYGLYFFDEAKKTLFRFEKPVEAGEGMRHPNQISLINQYVYRGERSSVLSKVKDFVVDSEERNAYILDGSVIWRMSL